MTVLNVTGEPTPPITEIRWSSEAQPEDNDYNLVQNGTSVTIKDAGLRNMVNRNANLCETKQEALNLIKALEKAIELGWLS